MRQFLHGHRAIAALLVLMALAVRLAVPVGFMPSTTASGVTIVPCPAAEPVHVAMPGMHHGHDAPGKAAADCPFAGLSLPSLGGADAVQIAALILAIFVAGMRLTGALPERRILHLRPPLRGPPARG